jgi:hypothetical protein
MLAWRITAAFYTALICKALFAFQKQLFAFTAALAAFGIKIDSQGFSPAKY